MGGGGAVRGEGLQIKLLKASASYCTAPGWCVQLNKRRALSTRQYTNSSTSQAQHTIACTTRATPIGTRHLRKTLRVRERQREAERDSERETERQRQRETETETETDRHIHTHTHTHTHAEREREKGSTSDREREREHK